LASVFFEGAAPTIPSNEIFDNASKATVYYLPKSTGWGATFAGRPTALWLPQAQTAVASFGLQTNQFGFYIKWARGQTVVVEACANLCSSDWHPVQTNTLVNGTNYFSDATWTNYPQRYYRIHSH